MARDGSVDAGTWLLYQQPTSRQSRSALTAIAVLLLAFLFLIPFAGEPLPHLNGFIPAIDAMIFVTDFITSALLFSQFSIHPSRALLALASGYLFTALIVIAHALSFPGAFPPTENLGSGVQTTLRLYLVWHLAMPAALVAYARLKRTASGPIRLSTKSAIVWSAASVVALVSAVVWLAIAGDKFLPSLYVGSANQPGPLLPWVTPFVMLIGVLALVSLWAQRRSALDQWLIVVAVASIVELVLSAQFGNAPFSLGFYTGRIFSLVTSTVILTVILVETTHLYARLARANAMLERERQNKLMNARAIIAALAHEIKQPLTAMASNASAAIRFLGRVPPDHEQVRSALNQIREASHRTSEVFDGVRALFGKVDQGQIDVNRIIVEVIQSLHNELKGHQIAIRTELLAELPLVNGHGGQLREVISNLVTNALEAMSAVTDRNRVLQLRSEQRGRDAIVVSVEDTGPGIDPTRLNKMFDAFVTTKSHGTGLGLAICRLIIEQHGGQLTASSDGKSGSLFQFILPLGSANVGTNVEKM